MYPIKYKVRVIYEDFMEGRQHKDYDIFALTDSEAKSIAREIFCTLVGESEDMKIGCHAMDADTELAVKVISSWNSAYNSLSDKLIGKTYPDFLELYQELGGFNLVLGEGAGFYFKLLNFTIHLYMENGLLKIDNSEVYYSDEYNGCFVIRGNNMYISC